MSDRVRHILSMSGGKDSTALAVYMRDRQPDMEYVFCDTKKELQETYDYLAKVEAYLGKPINRLNDERGFDHWLEVYGHYLPSPQMRWCTRQLKIRPFERFVGDDSVISYIGIRGDEHRDGYISSKPNITPRYPFKEDGITERDVYRILDESGLGVPDYYKWRTRSGCYFCFFQRKAEWLGLKDNHPQLFQDAKAYEKTDAETGGVSRGRRARASTNLPGRNAPTRFGVGTSRSCRQRRRPDRTARLSRCSPTPSTRRTTRKAA